jgi:hypothetical protein
MVIIIWAKIVFLKLLHFVQCLNVYDSILKSEKKYCFYAQCVLVIGGFLLVLCVYIILLCLVQLTELGDLI